MTEKRPVSTKALDAFLRIRHHTSLSAAVSRCGLAQDTVNGDTVSDDVVGRIARLHGFTPESLAAMTEPYA